MTILISNFVPGLNSMAKGKRSESSIKVLDLVKRGIEEKKGEEVITLDIYKTNPSVCDYFVICHGNTNRHVTAIAEEIQKTVRENLGEKPFHIEGLTNAEWILIDFVNVVVHIFQKEIRKFYDLEGLWADSK